MLKAPRFFDDLASGQKGKVGELFICGELLRRRFHVYTPVYDSGVDCLVKINGTYKEIQIKYCDGRTGKYAMFQARQFRPDPTFFFACHLASRRETWIIPSRVFLEMGTSVRYKNKEYVRLSIGEEGSSSYESLRHYRDNFELLKKGQVTPVASPVPLKRTTARIAGKHFKQDQIELEVLRILQDPLQQPLPAKEIVRLVGERLGSQFGPADLARVNGRVRWEVTTRFAIYQGLKKRGLIEAGEKNRYSITQEGIAELGSAGLLGK